MQINDCVAVLDWRPERIAGAGLRWRAQFHLALADLAMRKALGGKLPRWARAKGRARDVPATAGCSHRAAVACAPKGVIAETWPVAC